jgi:hypothetical protein
MSLFGKDSAKRMADTVAFIDGIQGIDKKQKEKFINANRNNILISKKISLGFTLINNNAEMERRRALRALLLCVGATKENEISGAKEYFKNKSKDDLIEGIKSYFPLTESDEESVLKVIWKHQFIPTDNECHIGNGFYKYTRKALFDKTVRTGGNCYGAACVFLYLGGVLSLRWLQEHGSQRGSAPPENLFTFVHEMEDPITNPQTAVRVIPAGKLVYLFRKPAGVHYAISTGFGKAVGHHNSLLPYWPKEKDPLGNIVYPYGYAPGSVYCTFNIGGYLKGMQEELILGKRPATDAYTRYASCVPTAGF